VVMGRKLTATMMGARCELLGEEMAPLEQMERGVYCSRPSEVMSLWHHGLHVVAYIDSEPRIR
jgi:hypothetical protein